MYMGVRGSGEFKRTPLFLCGVLVGNVTARWTDNFQMVLLIHSHLQCQSHCYLKSDMMEVKKKCHEIHDSTDIHNESSKASLTKSLTQHASEYETSPKDYGDAKSCDTSSQVHT